MMLMQKALQTELDMTFPKKYLLRFEQFRKQHGGLDPRPRRRRKPSTSSNVFSSNCKQGISLVKAKVYCCVLKESVEGSMCKACPCHEPEPLEYTLYKRV
jgi:hypothetical protein